LNKLLVVTLEILSLVVKIGKTTASCRAMVFRPGRAKQGVIMRQVLRFAVLALVLGSFSSFAEEETGLEGKWEGKDRMARFRALNLRRTTPSS
jgi:hypothetical protein